MQGYDDLNGLFDGISAVSEWDNGNPDFFGSHSPPMARYQQIEAWSDNGDSPFRLGEFTAGTAAPLEAAPQATPQRIPITQAEPEADDQTENARTTVVQADRRAKDGGKNVLFKDFCTQLKKILRLFAELDGRFWKTCHQKEWGQCDMAYPIEFLRITNPGRVEQTLEEFQSLLRKHQGELLDKNPNMKGWNKLSRESFKELAKIGLDYLLSEYHFEMTPLEVFKKLMKPQQQAAAKSRIQSSRQKLRDFQKETNRSDLV